MSLHLSGLGALAERFDHFLVDQFGVMLDGTGAYDWAPAALARLAAMGKTIVILSNSGKRAAPNEARLTRLGFARGSYRQIVSSGEVAFGLLKARLGQDLPKGAKVLILARDGDLSAIEGLGLRVTDTADDADLILIAGSEGERVTLADYTKRLAPAALRGVPALCTNPDLVMLTSAGPHFGAGRIAEAYQALGGPVAWIGKPYPAVYQAALVALGAPDPARVVCIGDSPDHDVRGGQQAGMATALVRTGLHAGLDPAALAALCRTEGAVPDFILPAFDF